MTETVHIENLVLGGGEAGKYVAWDLAQQWRSVVVIERALIGGSCPNIAWEAEGGRIRTTRNIAAVGACRLIFVDADLTRVTRRCIRRQRDSTRPS